MTFNQFVQRVNEEDVTKFAFDLALDLKTDQTKPNVKNKKDIKDYLISQNACREALEGLDDLWDAYQRIGG